MFIGVADSVCVCSFFGIEKGPTSDNKIEKKSYKREEHVFSNFLLFMLVATAYSTVFYSKFQVRLIKKTL